MNVAIEKRPSVTTTDGSSAATWRCRYGAQAAISSGSGSRLSGGRHFTTLVMNTSFAAPADVAEQALQQAAGATDERSALAVLVGTRALADEQDLGVGVALAGDGLRPRLVQPAAGADPDLGRDRLERRAALGGRHAGVPAAVRVAAARTQPRSTRISASWTALVAAPLRRLSLTTQNASPRPSGDALVLADPPDVDLVGAGGVRRQRIGRASPDRPGRRRPGTAANRVRARSGVIGSRVSTWTASLWATKTGTRTAVRADAQLRQVQDLAALGDDLPLLLGVAVVEEDVDLRQRVERDLVRVDRRPRRLRAGDVRLDLAPGAP